MAALRVHCIVCGKHSNREGDLKGAKCSYCGGPIAPCLGHRRMPGQLRLPAKVKAKP